MRNKKNFKSNGVNRTWVEISSEVLSNVRLRVYLDECNGDIEKSIRLYIWNTAVSASFYGALQMLEVTLREALVKRLYNQYGDNWYGIVRSTLDPWTRKRIEKCNKDLNDDFELSNFLRVSSTLSFGFWESLVNPQSEETFVDSTSEFERLTWRPALRNAFPNVNTLNRRDITGPIRRMKQFRDQIAHHIPVFKRDLNSDYQTILEILGWISVHSRQWVEELSQVPEVIAKRDTAIDLKF